MDGRVFVLCKVLLVHHQTPTYPSCKACNTKVYKTASDGNTVYRCMQCGVDVSRCDRYKLSLTVTDSDTEANVTVFGSNLDPLFGTSAANFNRFSTDLTNSFPDAEQILKNALNEVFVGQWFLFGFKTKPIRRTQLQKQRRLPVSLTDVSKHSRNKISVADDFSQVTNRQALVAWQMLMPKDDPTFSNPTKPPTSHTNHPPNHHTVVAVINRQIAAKHRTDQSSITSSDSSKLIRGDISLSMLDSYLSGSQSSNVGSFGTNSRIRPYDNSYLQTTLSGLQKSSEGSSLALSCDFSTRSIDISKHMSAINNISHCSRTVHKRTALSDTKNCAQNIQSDPNKLYPSRNETMETTISQDIEQHSRVSQSMSRMHEQSSTQELSIENFRHNSQTSQVYQNMSRFSNISIHRFSTEDSKQNTLATYDETLERHDNVDFINDVDFYDTLEEENPIVETNQLKDKNCSCDSNRHEIFKDDSDSNKSGQINVNKDINDSVVNRLDSGERKDYSCYAHTVLNKAKQYYQLCSTNSKILTKTKLLCDSPGLCGSYIKARTPCASTMVGTPGRSLAVKTLLKDRTSDRPEVNCDDDLKIENITSDNKNMTKTNDSNNGNISVDLSRKTPSNFAQDSAGRVDTGRKQSNGIVTSDAEINQMLGEVIDFGDETFDENYETMDLHSGDKRTEENVRDKKCDTNLKDESLNDETIDLRCNVTNTEGNKRNENIDTDLNDRTFDDNFNDETIDLRCNVTNTEGNIHYGNIDTDLNDETFEDNFNDETVDSPYDERGRGTTCVQISTSIDENNATKNQDTNDETLDENIANKNTYNETVDETIDFENCVNEGAYVKNINSENLNEIEDLQNDVESNFCMEANNKGNDISMPADFDESLDDYSEIIVPMQDMSLACSYIQPSSSKQTPSNLDWESLPESEDLDKFLLNLTYNANDNNSEQFDARETIHAAGGSVCNKPKSPESSFQIKDLTNSLQNVSLKSRNDIAINKTWDVVDSEELCPSDSFVTAPSNQGEELPYSEDLDAFLVDFENDSMSDSHCVIDEHCLNNRNELSTPGLFEQRNQPNDEQNCDNRTSEASDIEMKSLETPNISEQMSNIFNIRVQASEGTNCEVQTTSANKCASNVSDIEEHTSSTSDVKIKEPSVEVQAPSVEIQAPSVDIQAPNVGLQAPNIEIQAPNVGIQAQSVEIQAPYAKVQANVSERSYEDSLNNMKHIDTNTNASQTSSGSMSLFSNCSGDLFTQTQGDLYEEYVSEIPDSLDESSPSSCYQSPGISTHNVKRAGDLTSSINDSPDLNNCKLSDISCITPGSCQPKPRKIRFNDSPFVIFQNTQSTPYIDTVQDSPGVHITNTQHRSGAGERVNRGARNAHLPKKRLSLNSVTFSTMLCHSETIDNIDKSMASTPSPILCGKTRRKSCLRKSLDTYVNQNSQSLRKSVLRRISNAYTCVTPNSAKSAVLSEKSPGNLPDSEEMFSQNSGTQDLFTQDIFSPSPVRILPKHQPNRVLFEFQLNCISSKNQSKNRMKQNEPKDRSNRVQLNTNCKLPTRTTSILNQNNGSLHKMLSHDKSLSFVNSVTGESCILFDSDSSCDLFGDTQDCSLSNYENNGNKGNADRRMSTRLSICGNHRTANSEERINREREIRNEKPRITDSLNDVYSEDIFDSEKENFNGALVDAKHTRSTGNSLAANDIYSQELFGGDTDNIDGCKISKSVNQTANSSCNIISSDEDSDDEFIPSSCTKSSVFHRRILLR